MVRKLQQVRQELGLSLKDLADNIGVHPSTINYWEHGKRNPTPENRLMLEEELNIPSSILLEECEEDNE